jgi:glycosyltransferase involved in cell wall biosynthesis
MRVLTLSGTFPSVTRPTFGVFVRERTRYVAAHCDVEVVAPIAWFPGNRWVRGREVATTPHLETSAGLTVHHPRVLCVPRYGKWTDGILYFLCVAPFVASLRRRFPFDLIDAHFSYPDGVAGVLLGRLFGRPSVVTLRGTHDLRQLSHRLRRGQIRAALRAATRVIAVSESLRAMALECGVEPARVCVIGNGVDVAKFAPSDRDAARRALGLSPSQTILLGVGTLNEGKGHHRVVELLPRLIARHPGLVYIAMGREVGEDRTREVIAGLVRRHRLGAHVRLVPARPHDEVARWMSAADLFCLATRSEGWSNSMTEALACGLPVVTTRVGGNPEVVRHGVDGLLVPFWDARAFGDAVLQALETEWDRTAIAARAAERRWERTAEAVVDEFRHATGWRNHGLEPVLGR